jgi:hypothetical protein
MSRFEQIFARFGHLIPQFTGFMSFGLKGDKPFIQFLYQTFAESQKFDWVLLDFLSFCDQFDLISGTNLNSLAHLIPPQLTAVSRIIERFHRITPDPLFPFVFDKFNGTCSLDIANQELIDPENWALSHRLAIITNREKLFLDSCDRLFERIVTEAIERRAAFDLIVKCFSMKFHSAIERRFSLASEQRMPSCGNEIGFLLAKTIDLTFRKLKFLVMESLLHGFVRIFRTLPNKELFLSFHRRNLAARLLSGRKFCLLADLRLQTLARLPKIGSFLSDFRSNQSIVDVFESPSNVVQFAVIDSALFQQTREIRPTFPAAIQDWIAVFESFYTKSEHM